MKATCCGLLALLLSILSWVPTTLAQPERRATWERLDLAIDILADGTLQIVQTERIRFQGSFQRAYRELPLRRLLSITEVQVGEPGRPYRAGFNQPETFAVTRNEGSLRLDWWFAPTANATRTFELRYRVAGALRVYPDGDQLYWTAVPSGLAGDVEQASVVVRLPGDAPVDRLRAQSYLGDRPYQPATAITPREVRFAVQDLPPDRDYEVRVQFPPGLVRAEPPPWQPAYDRAAWYDSTARPVLNLLLLLTAFAALVGGFVLIVLRWYTLGRDPPGAARALEVRSAPNNLPAGLVGTLVDERVDLQDVLATIVDLGRRKIIRITEQRDSSLEGSDLDYRLELLEEQPLGLRGYERTVIGALFGTARETRLSRVKERWAESFPLFQSQLYAEAVRERFFEADPEAVRQRWRKRAIMLASVSLGVGLLAQALLGGLVDLAWAPFAALLIVGLAALAAAPRMPRRTRAGAVEAARWRAFGRHLAAGKPSPESPAGDDLSLYLPYAIALGVDRSWLENFQSVGRRPDQRGGGSGPLIIVGPGGWGFPGAYGGANTDRAGGRSGGGDGQGEAGDSAAGGERAGETGTAGGLAGGLSGVSGSLSDLLNAASEALSSGGDGGGWSGGGDFGGGGSGGGSGGFD